MHPKFLILKFHSRNLYDFFIKKILEYPHIKFFAKKINGTYTVIIKCKTYYENLLNISSSTNIYQSYIYLYTNISLILSELIIDKFEHKLTRQILQSKYQNLSSYDKSKLQNILSFVLDSNYPSVEAKKLYLYRKDLILNKLLLNFRHHNYLYVNHFAYFKLSDYYLHLENVIDRTCARY